MAWQVLPWAIAALVAGTAANQYSKRQVRNAQQDAWRDYSKRNAKRTEESTDLWEASMAEQDVANQQENIDKRAADKIQRVTDTIAGEEAYYDPLLPGQDRAPAVIQGEVQGKLSDELAKARARLGAMATLEGFSGRTFDRGFQMSRDNELMRNIGIFSQGDQNIFDWDMMNAAHKGDTAATIGDVLTAIGQAGLMAYGAGFSTLGANAATASTAAGTSAAGGAGSAPNLIGRLPTIGRVV